MTAPEHAVIVTYALTGDGFGTPEERDRVVALKGTLTDAIEAADAGLLDGTEFGGGRVKIYTYGPDADRLFAAMEPHLRAFPNRPATAVVRAGEVDDPAAVERHVDL